jgi:hypothetical protein
MTTQEYFLAGYKGEEVEKPMWSSEVWFAHECGKFCAKNRIEAKTFKMSRGYSCRVNKTIIVKFSDDLKSCWISSKFAHN